MSEVLNFILLAAGAEKNLVTPTTALDNLTADEYDELVHLPHSTTNITLPPIGLYC
jgi:hypothetical protein